MTSSSFPALVSTARRLADMTAAEFDFALTQDRLDSFGPYGWLSQAAYHLAGEDVEAGYALYATHSAAITAMTEAAKLKSYEGWSRYSRGPIRYAVEA